LITNQKLTSEGVTPVLIPNTAVKPLCAYGTAREAVWESRTLPGLKKNPAPYGAGFFLENWTQISVDLV